ncbi:MAG TPA: hypothetical protein VKR06_05345 [Ktedonosporobacter sp.]|nr:hypothetical protein [Ktedonosporobacter sp.]
MASIDRSQRQLVRAITDGWGLPCHQGDRKGSPHSNPEVPTSSVGPRRFIGPGRAQGFCTRLE